MVYSGLEAQTSAAHFAPTFVYVTFLGRVGGRIAFGDVFRAFNPWYAIGRAVSLGCPDGRAGAMPAPLEYGTAGALAGAAGIFALRSSSS